MIGEPRKNDGGALRVLVADDDPIQRSLINARLARLNGQTVEAEDGVAAWALLSSQTFDIAIVDLNMPNLDGFGLIQSMRDHPRTRHMPIIVITSRHDRAAIEAALQAGASSFLVKPIAWSTFEHHIGFLLRMVQSAKEFRAASQKAIATHRAREAILGGVCGVALSGTTWVMEEVDQLRRLPLLAESAPLLLQRLNTIFEECKALRQQAAYGTAEIATLEEKIAVSGRKERLELIMAEAARALAPAIATKSIDLRMTLPAGDTWVAGDGEALQQALHHLIANAVEHSRPGEEICVSAKIYPDGLLGVEITDHGEGMHPELLARTFAPLQSRFAGSDGETKIGYGLLIAKAIAEAHSGTLELRSMPGQGTTALLVLPPERVTNIVDEQ